METPPSSLLLVFGGPITADDVPGLCDRVCGLLGSSDAELIVCDVAQVVAPDVAAVDALARLQVAAKRLGRRVRVVNATAEFRRLLTFMGLADLVPFRASSSLGGIDGPQLCRRAAPEAPMPRPQSPR